MKSEIEIYEALAKIEVEQAKTYADFKIAHLYLLTIIKGLREILQNENQHTPVVADGRYRTFVITILQEYKKQELPKFDEFMARVLIGK